MTKEEIKTYQKEEEEKVLATLKKEEYSEEIEELVYFMLDEEILPLVIKEILHIGAEDLSDLLIGMTKDNEEPMGFFNDDNHIHWDSEVTSVNWEEISGKWE